MSDLRPTDPYLSPFWFSAAIIIAAKPIPTSPKDTAKQVADLALALLVEAESRSDWPVNL